eukprot:14230205-Alexandrium_andersonii.AAC.1
MLRDVNGKEPLHVSHDCAEYRAASWLKSVALGWVPCAADGCLWKWRSGGGRVRLLRLPCRVEVCWC